MSVSIAPIAAILPLSLHEAIERLPQLTARLEPALADTRQLQLSFFRDVNGKFHAADRQGAVGHSLDPVAE